MTYYGFDMKSGIWDTKLFPITKKDKEIHLSKKYQLHDLGGSSISFIVSFHPPQNNAHYKTNNSIQTRKRK
jgi:hypothetical protein